jgi:predicted nucleotidyltransferase
VHWSRVAGIVPESYDDCMTAHPSDLAATLMARRRVAHDRDDHRATALRGRLRDATARLRREGRLDAAWLIGSLAWGGFGERSDVDVVARGMDPARVGAVWADLVDTLDARVDLLCFEDLPEAFRLRVLSEGQRLDEP